MRAIHLLRSFVMVIAVWCVFAEVCVLYNHCHCHHHTFHQSNMRFRDGSRNTLALIWPLDKRADFISIYHFGFRILQLMSSSTSLCNICRSICRDMHEAKREWKRTKIFCMRFFRVKIIWIISSLCTYDVIKFLHKIKPRCNLNLRYEHFFLFSRWMCRACGNSCVYVWYKWVFVCSFKLLRTFSQLKMSSNALNAVSAKH